MSEFNPVRTKADLETLDDDEIVAGYMSGLKLEPAPGSDKSRSFWHGWRNGISDRTGKSDEAQWALVREMYPSGH